MSKFLEVIFISLCTFLFCPSIACASVDIASTNTNTTSSTQSSSEVPAGKYDWNSVMDAIIEVESGGNNRARSGSSAGPMQITPVLVRECNNILRKKNSKKRFKLSDRFSVAKSKEMFLLIQEVFNPLNSIEKAIRSWNGGVHYSVKRTQRYLNKVLEKMK
jgi:hypothetical protein